ncbi:hypothetical protein PACTADRAFT_32922 [Pachysolen tannophilus NRRL Y-2460]|uniref:Cullin family profile domain-containing protein n=1 Tax=Pachysolen tannophilus NRRL Y-2460 TaxID=669874 RepID=A0A1E4U0E4_PACTA|nr:hypothetical protein PACTADRAFT_32922 [Pachysolen tannophilus NRRL Y-2460]
MSLNDILAKFPANDSLSGIVGSLCSGNDKKQSNLRSILDNSSNSILENSTKRHKISSVSKEEKTVEFKKALDEIENIIEQALNDKSIIYEVHYQQVELICKEGQNLKLYQLLTKKLDLFFTNEFLPKVQHSILENPSLAVENFVKYWNLWSSKLSNLKLIFLYLDSNYLLYSTSRLQIYEYGMNLFTDNLVKCHEGNPGLNLYEPNELKTRYVIFENFINLLKDALLNNNEEMETEMLDSSYNLLFEFVKIIKLLDSDKKVKFSSLFTDLISRTFSVLQDRWLYIEDGELNLNYISEAVIKFQFIFRILKFYYYDQLHSSYFDSIQFKIIKMLIFDNLDFIYDKLLPKLLENQKNLEIKILFDQFKKWHQDYTLFADVYSKIFLSKVSKALNKNSSDPGIINDLLNIQETCKIDLKASFGDDVRFDLKARDAFTTAVNSNEKLLVEALVKYIDDNVRSKNEDNLSKITSIFKVFKDKDYFQEIYSRELTRRLAFKRNVNIELERYVFRLLSEIAGPLYTTGFEKMLEDIINSKFITESFNEKAEKIYSFKFELLLLHSLYWIYLKKSQDKIKVDFTLPDQINNLLNDIEKSYKESNESKKLSWCYNLNQITLARSFKNGKKKELSLSLLQGSILLLFDEGDELTFEYILQKLNIKDKYLLAANIASLCNGKHQILICSSKTNKYKPKDTFKINENFTSNSASINIKPPSSSKFSSKGSLPELASTSSPSSSSTGASVFEIDEKLSCTVVRVMKFNKVLNHHDLVKKVHKEVNNDHTIIDIKKVVEDLINREFIKRVEKDKYEYIP